MLFYITQKQCLSPSSRGMLSFIMKITSKLWPASLCVLLASCIPGLQEPPQPRTQTFEAANYFDVSASLNGKPIKLEKVADGYTFNTADYGLIFSLFPDQLESVDESEYDAYYAWNSGAAVRILQSVYEGNPKGFSFSVQNKTSEPSRIIWDESAVVVPEGSSSRVIHDGVKYSEMENSQPPTTIPPGANLDEYVGPINKISYSSNLGWFEEGLFLEFSTGDSASMFLALDVDNQRQNINVVYTATQPFQYQVEIPE